MLAIERIQEITNELHAKGVVKVEELAKQFNVSEMTIRRDLEKLETDGVAFRCYGGAALQNRITDDVKFKDKETKFLDAKSRIARYCYDNLLKSNHIIYLDAGTSVLEFAKLIVGRDNITVITNDVIIASFLASEGHQPIVLGGHVQAGLGCVHGYTAQEQLEQLRVEAAFVSGLTVDKDFDLFAATENKVRFRRTVIAQSEKTYLLMDSSKFNRQSLYKIHNLSEYTVVVTDKILGEEENAVIQQKGIEWVAV